MRGRENQCECQRNLWHEKWRRSWSDTWREDIGSAALEFVTAGMLLLIPVVYLVIVFAQVQGAALATEGGARQASRVFVDSPTVDVASTRAALSVHDALADFALPATNLRSYSVTCSVAANCLQPGSRVRVTVAYDVALPFVPHIFNLDKYASIPVSATAMQTVSRFHNPVVTR